MLSARQKSILVVEDEGAVASVLVDALSAAGYSVWLASNAHELEVLFGEVRPDLILLDLRLPDANGLVLCAELKARTGVPIVVCSGTRRQDDAELAFRLGADDFVRKPVEVRELKAHIDAVLRRGVSSTVGAPPGPQSPKRWQVGDLIIDEGRCRVEVGGQDLRLTPTEYRLLLVLANRPNEVVGREELCRTLWGSIGNDIERTLGVHVRRLRAKLITFSTASVRAERGFGYRVVLGEIAA